MLNNVNLVGRLTKDVELKQVNKENKAASFAIACDDFMGKEKHTSFFDCVIWNKPAENLAKYCHKGSLVAITGRLIQRTWEDKKAKEKKYKIEIIVNDVSFLEPKTKDESIDTTDPTLPF